MSKILPIKEIALYVTELFKQNQTPDLIYHNLSHTEFVVRKTYEIASHYSLNEDQMFIVSAAWFHDTGQLFGPPKDHEARSVAIMKEYMLATGISKELIYGIAKCILATKMPHKATALSQKILCDADTYNFGTKEFLYTDSQLKREFKKRDSFPAIGWERSTFEMMRKHKYFTSYAKRLLHKGKISILLKKESKKGYNKLNSFSICQ